MYVTKLIYDFLNLYEGMHISIWKDKCNIRDSPIWCPLSWCANWSPCGLSKREHEDYTASLITHRMKRRSLPHLRMRLFQWCLSQPWGGWRLQQKFSRAASHDQPKTVLKGSPPHDSISPCFARLNIFKVSNVQVRRLRWSSRAQHFRSDRLEYRL